MADRLNALGTDKQDPSSRVYQNYMEGMAKNTSRKVAFFDELLQARPDLRRAADFGAAGGELVLRLGERYPQRTFVGIDLNHSSLSLANPKRSELPNVHLVCADCFAPPLAPVDAVFMSSSFHELFSYGQGGFSYSAIEGAFRDLHSFVRPGGVIAIRDPARPDNPDEMLVVNASREGENPCSKADLLAADPSKLSCAALLRRFVLQFRPAYSVSPPIEVGEGPVRMPAWLVSEFIRHRGVLLESPEAWTSELREQYGVFSKAEFADFAKRAGYEVERLETAFNPQNRSVEWEGVMQVSTLSGEAVAPTRFPTQIYAVLRNPGRIGCSTEDSFEG